MQLSKELAGKTDQFLGLLELVCQRTCHFRGCLEVHLWVLAGHFGPHLLHQCRRGLTKAFSLMSVSRES